MKTVLLKKRKVIEMKMTVRTLAFLLLMIQLLLCAVSCTAKKNNTDESTDPSSVTSDAALETGESTGVTKLMENGDLKYKVIKYVADPDENTFNSVKRLRDSIMEYTGVNPQIRPDYSSGGNPADPNTYEILVGETNYTESKEVLSKINYGDYMITVKGNKIVIAAYSGEDIARAVSYFISNMLKPKDDQGNRKLEVTEYTYMSKRYIDKVDINGVDLREFSIAYGTAGLSDDYNLANAKIIRQVFSEKAGYTLPLIKDTDTCDTARRIFVGSSFANITGIARPEQIDAMSYAFKTVDKDFYIIGGGLLSMQLAAEKFITTFFNKQPSDRKVSITNVESTFLKVTEAPRAAGTEYRMMTYNITAQWEGWGGDYMPIAQRYEAFKSVIDIYDPDVIGLQEVSSQWSEKILNEMGDEYSYVHRNTPDGKFVNLSTIIYKKDKFKMIDSGLQYFNPQGPNHIRLVTWAILEDKQTGKQFAFFNTHWDPSYTPHHTDNIAVVNDVMSSHPNVKYAFSTGDYNTRPGSDPYNAFLSKTGLVNSMDVAKAAGTLKNEFGGCAKIGIDKETVTTSGPIDHIFITKNISVLSYETVIWNQVHHVSDHSPKYADVVLGQ